MSLANEKQKCFYDTDLCDTELTEDEDIEGKKKKVSLPPMPTLTDISSLPPEQAEVHGIDE